jgi:RNA polymerase sigma-70 factor (sigma-E family)
MSEQRGDVSAFCAAEHPRLVKALTAYTGDRDLAAELAQEALARAHRDWSRVSGMDSPGGWVHRVAVNLANSSIRRRRLERLALARAAARTSEAQPAQAGHDSTGVLRALTNLPRRQREAVALRFLLDLSVEQTAARMGCSSGTVRALTSQAVARLRAMPGLATLKEHVDG